MSPDDTPARGTPGSPITILTMSPAETYEVGRLMAQAFNEVFQHHGYPPPFAGEREAVDLAQWYLRTEPEGCFVAKVRQQIVGAAFLHRRGSVASVGPVAVDPKFQNLKLGRSLMEYVLAQAQECASIRLFQDAFNIDSFALYTKLRFRAVEIVPIVLRPPDRKGRPIDTPAASDPADRVTTVGTEAVNEVTSIDARLTLLNRRRDLQHLLETGIGFVLGPEGSRSGYLCAYKSRGSVYVGPAAAETDAGLQQLLRAVGNHYRHSSLVYRFPARQSDLLQALLAQGHRLSNLGTLMVRGHWSTPRAFELLAVFPESL